MLTSLKSNDDILTVRVLLEPSEKIREYENLIAQLREQLQQSDRRAVDLQSKLIMEMQRSMRLEDEVRELGRNYRNH